MSSFLSLTGLSPSLAGFPKTFLLESTNQLCGPNPTVHAPWFGLFPFRSPLLWKSIFLSNERTCFFLFLRLLRCFSSPGSLPYVMDWRMDDWSSSSRVSPFRYLRLNGYLLLPAAFRSLSRPSSALSAKASTLRSFLFDLPVLLAFKTGGSLAVSFHRVYNVMSSYCFDSLSLKDNSSDVSFPISKRLTFFWIISYMQFSRYMPAPLVRSSRLMLYQSSGN